MMTKTVTFGVVKGRNLFFDASTTTSVIVFIATRFFFVYKNICDLFVFKELIHASENREKKRFSLSRRKRIFHYSAHNKRRIHISRQVSGVAT